VQQPEPISGPGLYRTRNGKEVEIHSITFAAKGRWTAIKRSHEVWRLDGRYSSTPNHPLDITEKLQ